MDAIRSDRDSPSRRPAEAWLTPGRFALILAALVAAFFSDVLFAGKTFVFRDYGIFTYPLAYYQRECFWRGEWPLWDPLNNCGIPFLAQWNTATLYPLSLIYLLLPLTGGLNLFLLAHLFLAGFGMFLLASRWSENRLAAAVAGIAFVFNGMTLNSLMWVGNLAALAWMPWVVLATETAWKHGGGRRIATAALAGAVQMLAGGPEITLLTWFVVTGLWLGSLWSDPMRAATAARWFLVILLVSLLSAAQLLPFLDLLSHSDRSPALGASFWAIPSSGWANLLVPLFQCYRSPLGVYFQPGQDWTSSYYPGIGVLALALLAIRLARTPCVGLLFGMAVLGFILAMGENGPLYSGLLKIFPPLGFMRYPVKFEFLTTFSVPLLAAFGVAGLSQAGAWSATLRRTILLALCLAAVTAGVIGYSCVHPLPAEPWTVVTVNGLTRILFLGLILALVLACFRIQQFNRRIIAGLLLLVMVWLDAATHAPRQNPTVAGSVYQPRLLPEQLKVNPRPGDARAFLEKQTHDLVYGWMLSDPYQDYLGRRAALLGDCNLLDGIATPGGFLPLYVREQWTVFLALFNSATNQFPDGLADFLGIAWMSNPARPSDWRFRPSYLPVGILGPQPVFVEPSEIPGLLLGPDFDPRKTVYLAPEARAWLTATHPVRGTVQNVQYAAQHQTFETDAGGAALLVLAQTWYPPWRAYVDGRPVRLWRADYAFQALEVPAGKHRVVLIYRDRFFLAGVMISLVTLIGSGLFLWLRRRPAMPERRRQPPDSESGTLPVAG